MAIKKDEPLKTYTVLTPVDHDLVRYEPGDAIELTAEQAAALLACGAVA